MSAPPNFDRLARVYRVLEVLSFGPLLTRTRTHYLPALKQCRHALVFGDGDGRFLVRLLEQNPSLTADAVDRSAGMLAELRRRCKRSADRLRTHCVDALRFAPPAAPDVVVTHFFLDCLTPAELQQFVEQTAAWMLPGTLWVVSEFRIPEGRVVGFFAQVLVRSLYAAFRLLTGLNVSSLPDHEAALRGCGLDRLLCHDRMLGILRSEVWVRR